MRKYIIGFLVGAVMATAATAYGEDIVMIGKEIQGQTTVYKDGERLDTAIIVDGKSYAPTRSIGQAAGYTVKFDEGEIFLVSPTEEVASQTNGGEVVIQPEAKPRTLEQVNHLIQKTTLSIAAYKSGIKTNEELISNHPDLPDIDVYKQQLETFKQQLVVVEAKLAALEAEKAALEAQQ